jgi:glycosyltransferase involved in cell wall biosynthesis
MKIWYVINSLDGGGAALPVADVVGLMREQGHDVRVMALMRRDALAAGRLDAAGIPYEFLGGPRRERIRASLRLLRRLLQDRPDLLWTSLTHATVAGQLLGGLLGIPVVSWQHNAFLKPANRRLLRWFKGLTRYWVCDSETVADFAVRELGIERTRMAVWPLFIADAAQPAAAPWAPGGPFRIGSLGRLHPNKAYDLLIEALRLVRARDPGLLARLEVTVAGEGPERARLQALAAAADLANIHFPGFTDRPRAWLAGLHGYVQCSHNEGLCIAVHEAMQAGLPVVATRVGELPRSIRPGETGLLCRPGDAAGLADALIRLAGDPAGAAVMGAAARAWVLDAYSPERFRSAGGAAFTAALVACGLQKLSSAASDGSNHHPASASFPS